MSERKRPTRPGPLTGKSRFGATPDHVRHFKLSSMRFVRFELAALPTSDLAAWSGTQDAEDSLSFFIQPGIDAAWVQRLDALWADFNLRGAFVFHDWKSIKEAVGEYQRAAGRFSIRPARPGNEKPRGKGVAICKDIALTLNILGRARSSQPLLLAQAPITLTGRQLGRSIATNDERIIELALQHEYEEESL